MKGRKKKPGGNAAFMAGISVLCAALWLIQALRQGEAITWVAALVWLACVVIWGSRAYRARQENKNLYS